MVAQDAGTQAIRRRRRRPGARRTGRGARSICGTDAWAGRWRRGPAAGRNDRRHARGQRGARGGRNRVRAPRRVTAGDAVGDDRSNGPPAVRRDARGIRRSRSRRAAVQRRIELRARCTRYQRPRRRAGATLGRLHQLSSERRPAGRVGGIWRASGGPGVGPSRTRRGRAGEHRRLLLRDEPRLHADDCGGGRGRGGRDDQNAARNIAPVARRPVMMLRPATVTARVTATAGSSTMPRDDARGGGAASTTAATGAASCAETSAIATGLSTRTGATETGAWIGTAAAAISWGTARAAVSGVFSSGTAFSILT